ncbi:MAG: calcium-translocating P-type ATPase, PMCA-type [Erysipelotrichaceae bacterium]|jgi:Ca2+-transporting ATPase|nr:calcium-translocating P-type ATPase, PMCA-type [Erysipelotrichaceae bacterium]
MEYYRQSVEAVLQSLDSNAENGLSEKQAAENQAKHGLNELAQKKKQSWLVRFLLQFKDAMIILLLVAAAVSVIVDPHEWIDSVIILVVVTFNAILGVIQESRAEKALEALQKMSAPLAKVIRNGVRSNIPARELTVGDVILLEAGDFVPADVRLVEVHNLKVDESALTGESEPVSKISEVIESEETALGDMKNLAFSSTIVTYGRGRAVVCAIGMHTEVGKIANLLLKEDNEPTPLQVRLEQIGKVIGLLCIVICAIVFGIEVLSMGLGNVIEAFKTAVALAVAAVPEGLPAVVTIVLALGVQKMAKQNAIVRRLPAVETLGCASIVCSDKTGTLTQNKMTVVKAYMPKTGIQPAPELLHDQAVADMAGWFSLCSDATIKVEGEKIVELGDPTETALVAYANLLNHKKEDLLNQYTHCGEIAFDSGRKMMTVLYEKDGEILQITKGAPDVILDRCTNASPKDFEANDTMASEALRVLAVALKKHKTLPKEITSESLEKNMTFIGLVGMIDPPRVEVKAAIAEAKSAGVRTVMITGDHVTTAKAIAKDLGILTDKDKAITGPELENMADIDLIRHVEEYAVYARVAPEHKVRIVNAWQAKGQVVAMTGDGVNDSPALKSADIGCAMGITGTDVAKGAAAMILTDDNFATIITSIREGRGIYDNIRKDIHFLLSSNIGEVIAIFVASIIGLFSSKELGVPLLPIHLLWVNLITDSLPAFALGLEPTADDIMTRKPRPKNESFFKGMSFAIAWQGVMIGVLTLASFLIGQFSKDHTTGMTMAFVTLSISELFHSFNMKSDTHSIFHKSLFNNRFLWGAFFFGLTLQFLVLYVPVLSSLFKLTNLDLAFELIALGLAFAVIPIVEFTKWLKRSKAK